MRMAAVFVLAALAGLSTAHASQVCVGCPAGKKTRIIDGAWKADVELGQGVTKADAELIVRASRQKQITDKWLNDRFKDLAPMDLRTLAYVGDASGYFKGPDPIIAPAENNVRYFILGVQTPGRPANSHIVAVHDKHVVRVAVISVLP